MERRGEWKGWRREWDLMSAVNYSANCNLLICLVAVAMGEIFNCYLDFYHLPSYF